MKKRDYTLRIGLLMFAAIAGFFLLMKLFHLEEYNELRLFNFVIVALFSVRLAKLNIIESDKIEYLDGLRTIFFANAIAVVLSIIGLVVYVQIFDRDFIDTFQYGFLYAGDVSLGKVVAALFMEGMASAAIVSFSVMQYYKNVKSSSKGVDASN